MEAATIRETRQPENPARNLFSPSKKIEQSRVQPTTIKKLGAYEILGELGRGAMGIVYLGFDPLMHRKVAIKTLHYNQFDANELATLKERFFAEARAAGNLGHPNIVSLYAVIKERDIAYIAMDYVEGSSLAAYTNKNSLLPIERVYWIVACVADALAYAHAAGIVHRDIKPSNILYDHKNDEIKVADFGVARILDSTMAQTRTGEVLGSPLYMSPEQIRGEKVSGQSDIFSLGVMFYQLLTGEFPFKADNIAALTTQILQCKFVSVDTLRPELPPSAKKIIAKAMQKNPENRFPSALEMAAALDNALKKELS
jgi:serine/threonine-protein kinase